VLDLLKHQPRWYHYSILCGIAFIVRMGVFTYYMQYDERYRQPDSVDYHLAAWSLSQGRGLHYLDGRPMFWRTPGYPLLLSYFFNPAQRNPHFQLHTVAHRNIIWVQVVLCSLIPILAGTLAAVLTGSPPIIWATAIFSVFNTGYVLSSTYLLTDGVASLLFIVFLICLFCVVQFSSEELVVYRLNSVQIYLLLTIAALALSAYTWMRPMGQFVGLLAFVMLGIASGKTWRISSVRAIFFLVIFVATIMPWFVRKNRWTGQDFFCPNFRMYLNVFNAPKILARSAHIRLEEAHKRMTQAANNLVNEEHRLYLL
jgi:hypothetical protein